MAGIKLDGAGTAKMATLEAAMMEIQRIHGIVETMAVDMKSNKPTMMYVQQVKRVGTGLAARLKNQFGMISDQVTAMMLAATRGGGDQQRVRGLREGVASIKQALEIAIAQTKEKHVQKHEKPESTGPGSH